MPALPDELLVSEFFVGQPDGRNLCVRHYGSPALDRPVIYLHGFPGSRLQGGFAAGWARDLGCALITYDRPGSGRSDFEPDRTLVGSAGHVQSIADQLGLGRFTLFAVSGGVPHALAAAAVLGDRVSSIGLVSGLGPRHSWSAMRGAVFTNRLLCGLSSRSMPLAALAARTLAYWWSKRPGDIQQWFSLILSGPDRRVLGGDAGRFVIRDVEEALVQGASAAEQEFRILFGPWGFDLARIASPALLWHGSADNYLPPSMSADLARTLPHAHATIVPDAGHFLVVTHGRSMLSAVLDAGLGAERAAGAGR